MKKIITAIFLLFIVNIVDASTLDTNVKVEWVPNVYYNYEKDGIKYWGQFGYIYADNEIVYCIDIDNIITTNIYSSSSNIDVGNDIIQIIYFGYGYGSNNKLEDYMATQQLIWEYQGNNSYFTTKSEGKGDIINVGSYKNKIKQSKSKYSISPKFNQSFDFILGTTNIIEDTNGVLNNFVLGNNARNHISLNNNNIIIKAKEKGEGSFGIVTNYVSRGDNKVYYADNSQSLIKINTISNRAKVYKYMVYSGDIRINLYGNKLDESNTSESMTLKGNIFKLYDSNNKLMGTYESVKDGVITIYNLPVGNYTLEHFMVSEGYIKDKTIYNLEVSKNDIHESLGIYLNPMVTTLNIKSTFGNPKIGTEYGCKGEVYLIKNSKDEIVKELVTNDLGEASIELLYDEYKVYKKSTGEVSYIISKNDFNRIHDYNIFEPKYITKLKVHLYESGGTIPIKNANFMINNIEYKTNIDGIIMTDYLEVGKYLLEEEIPDGFYKNDHVLININENSHYYIENNDIYVDAFIYNEKIKEVEIELISNGGILTQDKVIIKENDNYGILPIPIKDNNKFVGWFTKNDILVTDETMYSDLLEDKLYAKYELIKMKKEEETNLDDKIEQKEDALISIEQNIEKEDTPISIEENIEKEDTSISIEENIKINDGNSNEEYEYREILEEEKKDYYVEDNSAIEILPNLGLCDNKLLYSLIYFIVKNEEDTD